MGRSQNLQGFTTGQQLVTTSGTPVQLSTNTIPPGVVYVIKAMSTNTGRITVSNTSSNALHTGTSFFSLGADQSMKIQTTNLNAVWIDATVSGEGVEYFFEF